MNRNPSYLLDIDKFAKDILQFVQNMDEVSFSTDIKTQTLLPEKEK